MKILYFSRKLENHPNNVIKSDLVTFLYEIEQYHIQLVFILFQTWTENVIETSQKKRFEKCKNVALVMEGEDCISQMFEYFKKN